MWELVHVVKDRFNKTIELKSSVRAVDPLVFSRTLETAFSCNHAPLHFLTLRVTIS